MVVLTHKWLILHELTAIAFVFNSVLLLSVLQTCCHLILKGMFSVISTNSTCRVFADIIIATLRVYYLYLVLSIELLHEIVMPPPVPVVNTARTGVVLGGSGSSWSWQYVCMYIMTAVTHNM